MRIISGRFARKHITAPDSLPVRPTTDFAKTGLFNILSNKFKFDEISALDLFAGTGNISYELLSRGTKNITCIDKAKSCTKFISATFNSLKASDVSIINTDALQFLNQCHLKFDLIFADPPFDYSNYQSVYEMVFKNELLKDNGLLVIEHANNINFENKDHFKEHRKYGAINFSFFELRPDKYLI
jgi:16S rRNA (guanine(966)-N(2))-methyltransferase RsmD